MNEIEIPKNIQVEIQDNLIKVSKEDKKAEKILDLSLVNIVQKENKIQLIPKSKTKKVNSILRTYTTLLNNLFDGIEKGFEAKLAIVYSHFPMTVKQKGNKLEISNFLGGKKILTAKIFGEDTKVEIKGKDITVKGTNKELVGLTAAQMEKATKINNRDRRVFQDGIYVTQKAKLLEK